MCSFHSVLIDREAISDGKLWVSKFQSRTFDTDFSDEVVDRELEQSDLSCLLDITSMLCLPALSSLKQIYTVFNFKDCPGTVDVNQSVVL